MPKRYPSSADTHAVVERVAPTILELLADGVPRSRRTIAAELADRHPKEEVRRTLMRLAVTDRIMDVGGKYGLGPAEGNGPGAWLRSQLAGAGVLASRRAKGTEPAPLHPEVS